MGDYERKREIDRDEFLEFQNPSLYWVRWCTPVDQAFAPGEPKDQMVIGYWCTGETADEAPLATMVGVFLARDVEEAMEVVETHWNVVSFTWVEWKANDWTLPDRFQLGEWQQKRWEEFHGKG